MLPFRLTPVYKDYLWGGTTLKTQFQKQTNLQRVAESWELSAHRDGDCILADGERSGMPFSKFVQEYPQLLGTRYQGHAEFPILVKLIDAKKNLSVQVHPDDDYAKRVENGQGKTEMWVILDCEPDAFLYFGFRNAVSTAEVRARLSDGTITEVLQKVPVKKGDVFFIPAGTVHAIGAGILVAEIQQNSNTTYRVYDYGRLDADGRPRALHIEKALEVADRKPAKREAPNAGVLETSAEYSVACLAQCRYFHVEMLNLSGRYIRKMDHSTFVFLLCTAGAADLRCGESEWNMTKGENLFIQSDHAEFSVSGRGNFLIITL